jgi:hypothetical protein
MSLGANLKHYAAFVSICVGGCFLLISLLVLVGAVFIDVNANDNGNGPPPPGAALVVTIVGGLIAALGVWLIRKGVKLRRRAIAAGSTVHIPSDGTGQTSRTGTKQPGFLTDGEPDQRPSRAARSMTFDSPDRPERDQSH